MFLKEVARGEGKRGEAEGESWEGGGEGGGEDPTGDVEEGERGEREIAEVEETTTTFGLLSPASLFAIFFPLQSFFLLPPSSPTPTPFNPPSLTLPKIPLYISILPPNPPPTLLETFPKPSSTTLTPSEYSPECTPKERERGREGGKGE